MDAHCWISADKLDRETLLSLLVLQPTTLNFVHFTVASSLQVSSSSPSRHLLLAFMRCLGTCRCVRRGLRRASPTLAARYKNKTIAGYQYYLTRFITWLLFVKVVPEEPYQWDDMLVEYRHGSDDAPVVSKSSFEKCVSALEFVLPHLKGHKNGKNGRNEWNQS